MKSYINRLMMSSGHAWRSSSGPLWVQKGKTFNWPPDVTTEKGQTKVKKFGRCAPWHPRQSEAGGRCFSWTGF